MKTQTIKILICVSIILLISGLTSCKKNNINDKTIVVGASPVPHVEILEEARAYIESKGYTLVIKKYDDYILPNVALSESELDANFFQHKPYLDSYNEAKSAQLTSVLAVHFEPLGIYSGKSKSLLNIPFGAKIGVPNDASNNARALLLLDSLGIIKVNKDKGFNITKNDITSNPNNVEIITFSAAAIPAQLVELDFGVINGNYALNANLSSDLLLASENKTSISALTYANIIAVREGDENSDAIKVLIEALSQQNIKEFINNKYNGVVVPLN